MACTSLAAYLRDRGTLHRDPQILELFSSIKMLIVNWLLVLCLASKADSFNWTAEFEHSDLAEVALFLVRDHLSKLSTTVVVAEYSEEDESVNTNRKILGHLLRNLEGRMAVQLYFGDYKAQLWEYYVFIVDSIEAFRSLRWKFPVNYFERQFYFLVVLTKFTPKIYDVMKRIFRLCYLFHVIDVTLIVELPSRGVLMFTYRHYTERDCRIVQPVLQYDFSRGVENFTVVFPTKLMNFHKCPLRVVGRLLPPLLTFDGDIRNPKKVGNWDNLSGLEGELLKIIAETLNFTIDLLPFPKSRSYVQNNTAYGCYEEMKYFRADVALGGFSASDPSRWMFSTTKQFYQSPYVYIVRGGRVVDSMYRLVQPFKLPVWFMLALLLIAGVVVIEVLLLMGISVQSFVFGHRNSTPITNMIAIFLGYPVTRMPGRNFARYLFLMWLFLTLIIRNAYQGSLYDALRLDKFMRLPLGLDDLMRWNYEILLAPDLVLLDILPNKSTVILEMNVTNRLEILEKERKKYAAVALEESYVYYMSARAYSGHSSKLRLMQEVVLTQQLVMIMPKHSIYASVFNKKLVAMQYSGLVQATKSRFTTSSKFFMKEQPTKRPLSFKHLSAMFKMFAVTIFIPMVVFVLELASMRYERVRRVVDWLQ